MNQDPILIEYQFVSTDASRQATTIRVELDPFTLEERVRSDAALPEWARLTHHQCEACPLNAEDSPYCPAAASVVRLVNDFSDTMSFHHVEVTVTTQERVTHAITSLQRALSSLTGLRMAVSGCPVLAKLRPMARFHLPLATREETVFRSVGAYLLAQYYLRRRGVEPDLDLAGLRRLYETIHSVNLALASRLRGVASSDANMNALALLDILAHGLPMSIDENLTRMEHLFTAYFE